MKTIYLDHAATTPLKKEVLTTMLPHLKDTYGNPSSLHHLGRHAQDVLKAARARVATVLAVTPQEIIFTGSGTEANNLAIIGTAHALRAQGKHILLSCIEHPSVLGAGEMLRDEGFEIEYLPVDTFGHVDIADTLSRVRPDTILISLMYANNEIGTIQPLRRLADMLAKKTPGQQRPLLHTDACQATGQLPVSPFLLGVDLMTLNSSKIYGPKGVGMLYVRDALHLSPYIVGGNQEFGRRAGTENLAGIVGFTHALELATGSMPQERVRLEDLRNTFIAIVMKALPSAILNGHSTERLPNNVHFSFPYIEGESLVLLLDTYGICASTGSACSAHDLLPSHVLRAIGQSGELIHGSIRFTLGEGTTNEALTYTAEVLKVCVERLQEISPLPLHV